MLEIKPPARADFDSDAAWGHARALHFKSLPQRKRREPQIVEVVREVPVEVIREVVVERRVEVPAEPVEVEIPAFLRFDPMAEFIAENQLDGETDEATLRRLRGRIVDLLALERDGGLTTEEEALKRYLTSHIKMGD